MHECHYADHRFRQQQEIQKHMAEIRKARLEKQMEKKKRKKIKK